MVRFYRMGLLWMLKGEHVIALTATGASLSGGLCAQSAVGPELQFTPNGPLPIPHGGSLGHQFANDRLPRKRRSRPSKAVAAMQA